MKTRSILSLVLIALLMTGIVVLSSCSLIESFIGGEDAHTHSLTAVEQKAPGCAEAGVKKHYVCSGCDEIFADDKGYVAITAEDLTIAPLGHQWINATCTEAKRCSVCSTTEGDPINHIPGEIKKENEIPSTCISEGSYVKITCCDLCKVEYARENVTTEKTEHTSAAPVVENEVPATCLTDGSYDSVVYCSVCKTYKISSETVTVEATGHKDVDSDGQCDKCEAAIQCDEHNIVIDEAVAPTCTTEGLTEGSHCSICNTVIVAQDVLPAAHDKALYVSGTLAISMNGSVDATGLTASLRCTKCDDYTESVTDFAVSASSIFNEDGKVTYGDYVVTLASLDSNNYVVSNDATTLIYTSGSLNIKVATNGSVTIGEDTYYWFNVSDAALSGATLTVDADNGQFTLNGTEGEIGAISIESATLNVSGNLTVYGKINVNAGSLNLVGGTVYVTDTLTATDSFILVTGGAVLNSSSNIVVKSASVEDANYEFGYRYRLSVVDGTINVNCSFVGGAIRCNSLLLGSIANDTKGYINAVNTASKGNGLDNHSGALRWMFAKGEINFVGGESLDGTGICLGNSGTSYIDFKSDLKVSLKNFAYGFGSWYANRYVGIYNGVEFDFENVNKALRGSATSNNIYAHSIVEIEYTEGDRTGIALVDVEAKGVSFSGEHTNLDLVNYPTADNYYKVAGVVEWVE